jgi:hypothetical protein
MNRSSQIDYQATFRLIHVMDPYDHLVSRLWWLVSTRLVPSYTPSNHQEYTTDTERLLVERGKP